MSISDQFKLGFETISRDAVISDCTRYRYVLKRWWRNEGDWVCWIMLNPSTADAAKDDPTIRRCMRFSRDWGYAGMSVVNLFAWRATDPTALMKVPDPIGPENKSHLLEEAGAAAVIVAAWGTHGAWCGRGDQVARLLMKHKDKLRCLGTTAAGFPKHPVRLPAKQALVPYVVCCPWCDEYLAAMRDAHPNPEGATEWFESHGHFPGCPSSPEVPRG